MERQDPQGEENGDPAFAHVPRLVPGPHGQHIPQPMRGGSANLGHVINQNTNPSHSYLPGQQHGLQTSSAVGNHHSQLSSSSKESSSSTFPAQKQPPQVSMSGSPSIPQSATTIVSVGSLQQGVTKAKDAHQIKLQQLQSQQQQLLMAAAAVASSAGTTLALTTGRHCKHLFIT